MKFGQKISADLYDDWKEYYLDYNRLKKNLKRQTAARQWTPEDEANFIAELGEELDKIYQFQVKKTKELAERIAAAEGVVNSVVEEYEASDADDPPLHLHHDGNDVESSMQEYVDSESSDDEDERQPGSESSSGLEERFRILEEEVATLVADVHDLALFTKLNFTGFIKIVKKHDKRTSLSLKTTFVQDFLDKRPFYKYNWDALIVKLSKLYDLVRTRGHPVQGDSAAGGNQSAFVRQTTKYWVHPDNLVHLKLAILRHLPVLVFNSKKDFEQKDAAITSIYFDNEDLDLYLGRLEKTEGAEAIRLRWYGDTNVKQIFVERKTHREDWTGEKSVKARFPVKVDKVNAFLSGDYTVDEEFNVLVAKGKKTEFEVESMKQLANEVQYAVLTRKLNPVMRTFYNRTAFQLPGDARVRISLDTELTMVREDNWDGAVRSGDNWRRTDIGIDWPFTQLPSQDKENFPYGVLEVKLQTQLGQEPPAWVTDLVNSHLVEAVPKFSKFIHGCATLLPNRVDLVPFWLPQMDIDIRKPDTGALHLERPSGQGSHHDSRTNSGSLTPASEKGEYHEPLSEGEDDEMMDVAIAIDENRRVGLSPEEAGEAISFRQTQLAEIAAERKLGDHDQQDHISNGNRAVPPSSKKQTWPADESRRRDNLAIDPLTPAAAFDKALQNLKDSSITPRGDTQQAMDNGAESDTFFVRDFTAVRGTRIAVPVRVEPKVYFASERTVLMWLQFSILLGTIATALLNFSSPDDRSGIIGGLAFTAVTLVAILYSAGIFVHRTLSLRSRSAEGIYYDKYGPTLLCFAIVAALGINFGFQLVDA